MLVVFTKALDHIASNSKRLNIEFPKLEETLRQQLPVTFYNYECPIRSDLRPAVGLEFTCDWDIENILERTRTVQLQDKEKEFVECILELLLFSEVMLPFKDEYEIIFYTLNIQKMVSEQEFSEVKEYLRRHVGMEGIKLTKFTRDAIASYIAEA